MRLLPSARRAALGLLVFPLLVACEDELPTATGADLFPGGTRPTTVELILGPEQFLVSDTVLAGFTRAGDAGFLVVAQDFDGVLDANALVRFTPFPDSVTFAAEGGTFTVGRFEYTDSRIVTVVNPNASTTEPARLRLWALAQAWDTAGVSWTSAGGRENPAAWQTPGGTRGELIAEATWTPGDTLTADTVSFPVDSATVVRMAAEGFHGLLLTAETPGSRVQTSRLVLQAGVRPASHTDTVVTQTVASGPQTFIFTPDPAQIGAYRVGGPTGDRTVLAIDLTRQVPACADFATRPDCPMVPLSSVMINQANLLLEPVAGGSGFRPLQSPALRLRRVLEPELGRAAPLGELLYADTIPASLFTPNGEETLSVDVTGAISVFTANGLETLTTALLTSPEGGQFGYLFFADRPRLRVVYTLPLRPTFP